MTSHAKNRRRLMQWERFHKRFPLSGKWQISSTGTRVHQAHVMVHARCVEQGRSYPVGIRREPYKLFSQYDKTGY